MPGGKRKLTVQNGGEGRRVIFVMLQRKRPMSPLAQPWRLRSFDALGHFEMHIPLTRGQGFYGLCLDPFQSIQAKSQGCCGTQAQIDRASIRADSNSLMLPVPPSRNGMRLRRSRPKDLPCPVGQAGTCGLRRPACQSAWLRRQWGCAQKSEKHRPRRERGWLSLPHQIPPMVALHR